jgi:cytochrome subunit of sulfide dehydrogenase
MHARHAAFAALVLAPAVARAAAPPAGASSCAGCHAEAARPDAVAPSIRGQPASELAAAMRAYAAGERPGTVMDRIAKGFSEDEIQAIAAWIASQPRAAR